MKLRDLLQNNPAWQELCRLTADMLDAGAKAHGAGMYLAGLRLSRIVAQLADTEVEQENESRVQN